MDVIVGYSLSSPVAANIVRAALTTIGAEAVRIRNPRPWKIRTLSRLSALVDDLAPWTEGAIARIAAIHRARLTMPIVVYYPDTTEAAGAVGRLQMMSAVTLKMQVLDRYETKRLRSLLTPLLANLPEAQFRGMLGFILPQVSPHVGRFVDAACRRLARGASDHPQVADLAIAANVSLRHLERQCQICNVPNPNRLLDMGDAAMDRVDGSCGTSRQRAVRRTDRDREERSGTH